MTPSGRVTLVDFVSLRIRRTPAREPVMRVKFRARVSAMVGFRPATRRTWEKGVLPVLILNRVRDRLPPNPAKGGCLDSI